MNYLGEISGMIDVMSRPKLLVLGLSAVVLANLLVLIFATSKAAPEAYAAATFCGLLALFTLALANPDKVGVTRQLSLGVVGALAIGAVFIGLGFLIGG